MQLSAELFEEIIASLNTEPPAQEAGRGQRRGPRVGVKTRAVLIPLTDRVASAPLQVPVRDLSAGGIGFLHARKIGLDEQFVIVLPQGDQSVAILCSTAYYQPLAENLYAIGAKFTRVLRQAATPNAIAPATAPAPARRAAS